jgi:hypothetical protein
MSSGVINHDQSEPNAVAALITIIVVFVCLLGVSFGSYFYFNTSLTQELNVKEDTSVPRLLKSQRLYEDDYLYSLKWENKKDRIIHIPIELAMKNVIKRYN